MSKKQQTIEHINQIHTELLQKQQEHPEKLLFRAVGDATCPKDEKCFNYNGNIDIVDFLGYKLDMGQKSHVVAKHSANGHFYFCLAENIDMLGEAMGVHCFGEVHRGLIERIDLDPND